MKANTLTFLLSLSILTSPQVLAKKNLGSHEHGSAKISLSYENKAAEIELDAPADSNEARELIPTIREAARSIDSAALVGGTSAVFYDVDVASTRDRNVIIPIVLVLIALILGLLLRSILAAVVLLATVILSFVATLGALL